MIWIAASKTSRTNWSKLKERESQLEKEMAKVARVGKKEEIDFAEDVSSWPGIWIGTNSSAHGDYLVAFRDGAGIRSIQ